MNSSCPRKEVATELSTSASSMDEAYAVTKFKLEHKPILSVQLHNGLLHNELCGQEKMWGPQNFAYLDMYN